MDLITNIIGSIAGSAGAQTIDSLMEQLVGPEDEVTIDQLVAIGLVKSHGDLWPIGPEVSDAVRYLAEDFESLRFEGFSDTEALKIVQFIYAPRIFLIRGNHLPKDFVLDLAEEQINQIVENALLNFLEAKGVDPDEDLNFHVANMEASMEDDQVFKDLTQ